MIVAFIIIIIKNFLFYSGPNPKGPTINSTPEVVARTRSTVTLTCLSDQGDSCPTELIWHNDTALLERSTKYQIEQKEMRSKCKLQSILSIFNVTEDDEGNYSCNCDSRVAAIFLKVFVQSQTGTKGMIQQIQFRVCFKTLPSPNPEP